MSRQVAGLLVCLGGAMLVAPQVQAYSALDGDSPWMLGDWGGKRTALEEQGISFTLGYVSESAWNAAGGYNHDRTARYSDQWTLGTTLDLDRLFSIPNATFQFSLTDRNGRDITRDRLVDPRSGALSSTQEVWGRGQTTRITQLWYQQSYFDNTLDIKLGRIPVGGDFASIDSQFQNLALGSGQPGNWAGGIWYNWPVSQWAGRVRLNMTPEWYAQVGVFNQNPSNLEVSNALDLKHSGTTGTLVPVELGWTPRLGAQQLPGKYAIGGYYSSAPANAVYLENDNGDPRQESRRYGAYFVAQQQVTAHEGDVHRGMTLTFQGIYNDRQTANVDRYLSAAMSYVGPFDARPKDDMGVGLAWVHVNDDVTRSQRRNNTGQAFGSVLYSPVQGSEYDMEVYYGFHMSPWLTLRPNIQYMVHPGGVTDVDNALVGGLKVQATL